MIIFFSRFLRLPLLIFIHEDGKGPVLVRRMVVEYEKCSWWGPKMVSEMEFGGMSVNI